MPPRRNPIRRSLESVLENLPDRFYEPKVYAEDGAMTGLRAYIADLSEHLRQELGTDNPPTVEAMTALGIAPAEWYRALMMANS
jgi:hypothetical protein